MKHMPDHKTQPVYGSVKNRLPIDWCPTCHRAVETADGREARLYSRRGPKRPKFATTAANIELWDKGEWFSTRTLRKWEKRGLIEKTNGRSWQDAQVTAEGCAYIVELDRWRKEYGNWKRLRMAGQ